MKLIMKNGKHLYYWGLLGFIPNVGLIAGLILSHKGIFTYKDKKLILIGVCDILFTFLFWMVFSYEVEYGTWWARPKAMLAEMELNTVVKSIEFHKIKNGSYPDGLKYINFEAAIDGLKQINDDEMTSIFDPFLPGKNENIFTYKKIRNKYTIFSVGLDRIPYTNDDIYPTSTKGDTIKFGFIKNFK